MWKLCTFLWRVYDMNKTNMTYFDKEDIIHIRLSDEPKANSYEISPNITAEVNERGELIGIEILQATNFIRDTILESVQAKILNLASENA